MRALFSPAWQQREVKELPVIDAACSEISLHVPLTADTVQLIEVSALSKMKSGAKSLRYTSGSWH
jgi:phosphoglycerate dehydrogenase-like enzyme